MWCIYLNFKSKTFRNTKKRQHFFLEFFFEWYCLFTYLLINEKWINIKEDRNWFFISCLAIILIVLGAIKIKFNIMITIIITIIFIYILKNMADYMYACACVCAIHLQTRYFTRKKITSIIGFFFVCVEPFQRWMSDEAKKCCD